MLAFHGIFGAYGFWLPNDPRGSWSSWVGSWDLYRYGPATKVNTTHSLADRPHDRELRRNAKRALRYPPVVFDGIQAKAIAAGISRAIDEHGFRCFACAVLPTHAHVVLDPAGMPSGQAIGKLKRYAGDILVERKLHPLQAQSKPGERPPLCFVRRAWKVYLDTPGDVSRSIRYAEQNPVKEGLPKQRWSFVETPCW
ncbi:MAG: hypothetical protein AAGA29_13240 [Planctomycetota bacterium]